jgi:hypothetical protein
VPLVAVLLTRRFKFFPRIAIVIVTRRKQEVIVEPDPKDSMVSR